MRYLIGVIVVILIIIFVIIKLLSGGGHNPPTGIHNLVDYANTGTTVRYIIDEPVQSDTTHHAVTIDVGQNAATLMVTQGYEGQVESTKSYPNNSHAYAAFLLALQRTGGFTKGNNDPTLQDERGYCATGNRFSYDIVDEAGNRIQHYWSTSCKTATFKGDVGAVNELFRAQIPDFDTLTANLNL